VGWCCYAVEDDAVLGIKEGSGGEVVVGGVITEGRSTWTRSRGGS
jgi:hypothetical protein